MTLNLQATRPFRRIAITIETDLGSLGAFIGDIASDAWTRVPVDGELKAMAWMPDGKRLLVYGLRSGELALLLADVDEGEAPQKLYVGEAGRLTVAHDGSAVLLTDGGDIARLALTGEQVAKPWLETPGSECCPTFFTRRSLGGVSVG